MNASKHNRKEFNSHHNNMSEWLIITIVKRISRLAYTRWGYITYLNKIYHNIPINLTVGTIIKGKVYTIRWIYRIGENVYYDRSGPVAIIILIK